VVVVQLDRDRWRVLGDRAPVPSLLAG